MKGKELARIQVEQNDVARSIPGLVRSKNVGKEPLWYRKYCEGCADIPWLDSPLQHLNLGIKVTVI